MSRDQLHDVLDPDGPPRTPSKYDTYRPSRRGRPSVRDAFPTSTEDERDPHDLSLSPEHAARTSIVDNMLLSLDQFATADVEEDYRLYNSILGNSDSPVSPDSMKHGRYRSHTYSSSLSSDPTFKHDDFAGDHTGLYVEGHRPSDNLSDYLNGLGGIGSRSSSPDHDFGPPFPTARLGTGSGRRSASFDYGTGPSHHDTHLYNGIDAAPTPSVPAGPREQYSIHGDNTGSLISLNKQLSRTPVSSSRSSMKSTRPQYAKKNLSEHLGTENFQNNGPHGKSETGISTSSPDPSAPSPAISYNKTTKPLPAKERPGFFRRVFGNKASPFSPQVEAPRAQEDSNKDPDGTKDADVSRMNSKRVVNKKSSFFRRRKKSVADQVPPPPPPQLPPEIKETPNAESTKATDTCTDDSAAPTCRDVKQTSSREATSDSENSKNPQRQRKDSASSTGAPKPRYSLYPHTSSRDRSPLPPGVIRRSGPSTPSDTEASRQSTPRSSENEASQRPNLDGKLDTSPGPALLPILEGKYERSPTDSERNVSMTDTYKRADDPSELSGDEAAQEADSLQAMDEGVSTLPELPSLLEETSLNMPSSPPEGQELSEPVEGTADSSAVPSANDREQARGLFDSQNGDFGEEPTASWLGDPDRAMVRTAYMELFEWSGTDILSAMRDMCTHLVLKGETQQVDRVLDAFSSRWCECNPGHCFRNTDVVHTVTYSILLLNTDLHLADIEQKMTKSQFIRNTMPTICRVAGEEEGEVVPDSFRVQVENVLKEFYTSIQKNKLPLHGFREDGGSRSNLLGPNGVLRRNPSTISKSGSDTFARTRSADSRYGGARWSAKPRVRGRVYPSRTSIDDQSAFWNSSTSSTWSKHSLGKYTSPSADSIGSEYPRGEYQQSVGFANALSQAIVRGDSHSIVSSEISERAAPLLEDETLELAGAPWAKEGSVWHKHHLESVDKRAKDRNWNECFAVIQQGWMRLFSFSQNARTLRPKAKQRQSGGVVVGGGNWTENAEEVWKFLLRQTIASALPPPGYSKSRPHVWALSLPTGAVHLFQVGTPEIVREFVSTANYWSARLSKEPLIGGVSNIEHGWSDTVISSSPVPAGTENKRPPSSSGNSRHSNQGSVRNSIDQQFVRPKLPADRINISDWTPPQQSMVASSLPEGEQLKALQTYVQKVEAEMQKHNDLRLPMTYAFSPRHPNGSKAMANWERKSSYLLREIVKFRTYVESLQFAISQKNRVYS